jgi:hypothetical protein
MPISRKEVVGMRMTALVVMAVLGCLGAPAWAGDATSEAPARYRVEFRLRRDEKGERQLARSSSIEVTEGRSATVLSGGSFPLPKEDAKAAARFEPFGVQFTLLASEAHGDQVKLHIELRKQEMPVLGKDGYQLRSQSIEVVESAKLGKPLTIVLEPEGEETHRTLLDLKLTRMP